MSTPLRPFSPPAFLTSIFDYLSGIILMRWFLFVVIVFWIMYTLVAIYHWLRYSHASWVAFPSIIVHVIVSFALMSYAFSGII